MAEIPGEATQYGACDAEVNFKARQFEPRPSVRGMVARTYFYMFDRYDLNMSRKQERLFMAWHAMHPVTAWERERDRRIAAIVGHNNPFVTGKRTWSRGHKNSAEGLSSPLPISKTYKSTPDTALQVRGNKRSRVYHLSEGCPSYNRVSDHNRVAFDSIEAAERAGYRKAGNCR